MISEYPLTVTEIGNGGELRVGETLRVRGATWAEGSPVIEWHRGNTAIQVGQSGEGWTTISGGETQRLGRLSASLTWSHDQPGNYEIRRVSDQMVLTNYEVKPADGQASSIDDPDDYINVDGTDDIDPSDYRGIVNADNDEGIALAPALRRQGASLGPDGGTVTLPDGETVGVGAIEESDEVARYLEGDDAGDVVEADRPAVDGGSSSGGSGGMIGGAVAVVVLLVAGAAALLGGGD